MIDVVALVAGFALPWILGAALVAVIGAARLPADGRAAWIAGSGYFVGLLLATLWMRVLSAIGVTFGVLSIGVPMLLAAAALVALALRGRTRDVRGSLARGGAAFAGAGLAGWTRAAWVALVAWLALRFGTLAVDVLLRPLYPWDAWNQWATKARVWYEFGRLLPFVDATTWFNATTPWVFFDAAPRYPATVPLLQVWGAIVIGRFDDALVNLPWWLAGIALALALFGALRRLGLPPLAALVGAWIAVSLPILDVHVALAGYADLWMAGYVTVAVLAVIAWTRTRSRVDVAVALLAALGATLTKTPGIAWVLTIVPGLVVALWPRRGPAVVAAAFAIAVGALAVLVRGGGSLLNYKLQSGFNLPWSALGEAYLTFGNWNLLFFGVAGAALLANRRLRSPHLAPLTAIVAAGIAFLIFGFGFTSAGAWVEDQSTVNRATLHLAPLLAVFVVLAFHQWRETASPPSSPRA